MNSLALIALAAAAAILIPGRARAQTPPTPAEIAAYRGLHAAAARGDAADLNRLVPSRAAAAAAILIPGRARAQTPPTPAEIAAYRGLHAAAARGDAADLNRLVQSGAGVTARGGSGRPPRHVAACAGRWPIAQALLAAGADPSLLDNQRYDAVTI